MTDGALLAELEDAGVRLSLAGDDLRYQTRPGVRIAPFAEDIKVNKCDLLKDLLQREIVAAVNVEPADFDRAAYDALWARWKLLDAGEAS